MGPDLALALELADAADALSLPSFRAHDLVVETKPDLTPVTEADRAVEAELRRLLTGRRPEDAVLGEEEGEVGRGSARWVIDPIDGTKNFSRGIPVWATLIALERDGRVDVGVVSAPALGRRWWAARGEGAWRDDGERLRVSRVAALADATLLVSLDRPVPAAAFGVWHLRALGDFWAHMLVAEGSAEIAIDAIGVSVWDLAAPLVIVEEAGGRFTDLEGRPRADGRAAIASNGLLHEDALALAAERD